MNLYEQGITDLAEKIAATLKERSRGEYDTWGFVALFLDMVSESKAELLSKTNLNNPAVNPERIS